MSKILDLILGFLKVGCFSFGGAYGAIPLIRDVVLSHGWLTEAELSDMIAVSESTPGPIMVNLATFVGAKECGLPGALAATAAVVLPSFVIILLLTAILRNLVHHPYCKAVLSGVKPCIIGIVAATGLSMTLRNFIIKGTEGLAFSGRECLLTAAFILFTLVFRKIRKKKYSPISLILFAAVMGILCC